MSGGCYCPTDACVDSTDLCGYCRSLGRAAGMLLIPASNSNYYEDLPDPYDPWILYRQMCQRTRTPKRRPQKKPAQLALRINKPQGVQG